MSACHHRIAYMKGVLYGVEDLEPLWDYTKDPKAWREEIEDLTGCSSKDAKGLGVILLNTGGLQVWMEVSESRPDVSEELRAELEDFRACCKRIRDTTLEREAASFPPSLRNANPRRRWSFAMCAVQASPLLQVLSSTRFYKY